MRVRSAAAPLILALGAALCASRAPAQSLTPMRGEVRSVSDAFAVRIFPSNPYDQSIRVEVHVYDQDFSPVPNARVVPGAIMLAPGGSRAVIVAIPFDGLTERKVRVCAESIPFPNSQAQVRAQVCGKFLGQRLS